MTDLEHGDEAPAAAVGGGPASETELKFELGPNDLRKLTRHVAFAAAPQTRKLTSVYYDTPAFDLRKAGFSLRVRKEGRRFVQTVKQACATEVFRRGEWEAEVATLAFDPGVIGGTPIAELLNEIGCDVVPVSNVTVSRAVRVWASPEATIEISVDKGQIQAGANHQRLAEMELELKAGDVRAVYALARELFELAPIRLSLSSKSERGYRLASTLLAEKSENPALTATMTVAGAVSAVIKACLSQITGAAETFRRNPSPQSVHETRIGLRRLRTCMKVFKDAVADDRYGWIEGELKWLTGELGEARDLDVFVQETFQPAARALSDPKAGARYAGKLEKARAAAYVRAQAAVESRRCAGLVLEIALWVEDGPWRRTDNTNQRAVQSTPIGPFASEALGRMTRHIKKRGEHLRELDGEHRHRLRIRAKRLRYSTDLFANAFGGSGTKRRREFSEDLKAMQTALGRLNDMALASDAALSVINGGSSKTLVFVAGELVGRVRSREPQALGKAVKAYQDFAQAKRFWPKPYEADPERPG